MYSSSLEMGWEQPAEPQLEGKHRILLELGHGGTADVYLAVARGPIGFGKLVVLKTLKSSLEADPDFREMFFNEARLAARLNHPNIVQTYEVVEHNGVPMMVMEYLDGQSLSAILKRAKRNELSLPMHLRIICDVLAGLQYAHDLVDFDGMPLGVIHRDATPQNVFVTFDGQVKLLDFGIAKLSVSAVETQQGIVKGKIRYIAPENILGMALDRRADIYAVGVMIWEAAAGEPLWKGMTDPAIMSRVIRGDVPSPRSLRPEVSDELERICMKALAREPDDRYASAAELETELQGLLIELAANVRNRDIGKMVSSLFGDVRARTKTVIEQQLKTAGTVSLAESQTRQIAQFSQSSARLQVGSGARRYWDTETLSEPPPSRPMEKAVVSPSRRWILGACLLAAALGWLSFRHFSNSHRSDTRTAPSSEAELPSSPAARPAEVQVKISAHPRQASLFLDGQPLPSNPAVRVMRRDNVEHTVRAEASGYEPILRRIVLDRDSYISLTLDPAGEESNAAPRSQPGVPVGKKPANVFDPTSKR